MRLSRVFSSYLAGPLLPVRPSTLRIREAALKGPTLKSALAHTYVRDSRDTAFLGTRGWLCKVTQVRAGAVWRWLGQLQLEIDASFSFVGARWTRRQCLPRQGHDGDGALSSARWRLRTSPLGLPWSLLLSHALTFGFPPSVRLVRHPDRHRLPSEQVDRHPPLRSTLPWRTDERPRFHDERHGSSGWRCVVSLHVAELFKSDLKRFSFCSQRTLSVGTSPIRWVSPS